MQHKKRNFFKFIYLIRFYFKTNLRNPELPTATVKVGFYEVSTMITEDELEQFIEEFIK